MRITIAPASTKCATATIQALLGSQLEVRAVYRDLSKVPPEFKSHTNFEAVQGDVADASSLDFSGTDAVLAITPPTYDDRDILAHAESVSKNVKDAVEKAGSVQRLVLLSSGGAQFSEGVGEIKTNNVAERVFSETRVADIVFVRCAYFMENWASTLETLRAPEPFILSTITPADWKSPMVAVKDIGSTLAVELTKKSAPSKPHVFELHGPQSYNSLDVQAAFSEALGKDVGLKLVEKHELHGFYSKVFPASIVPEWVEMATSFLPGGILARDEKEDEKKEIVRGATGLVEAIKALVDSAL